MACDSTHYSGTGVVLKVNVSSSAGTDMKTVAGQRNVTISSSATVIDLSNKDTGAVSCITLGRLDKTVSLDALIATTCEGQSALIDAHDNRTSVVIAHYKDGTITEQATAYVTNIDRAFPDNAESTFSASLRLVSAWS